MKILIIGGKRFVGYHIAKNAINKGHEVIFFNRGKTNSELFPECKNIIGDRNHDMNKLEGQNYDCVIDTCAYFPNQIEKSLDVLEGHFDRYLLISTLSVVLPNKPFFTEECELFEPNYSATKITAETYGPLKVACEEVLQRRVKDKAIIIRPGYIVGDADYTYRFTYLPIMMHFLDEIIVPNTNDLHYSFIDGADLGNFVIHSLEQTLTGIFHTVGPGGLLYDEYIDKCREVVNPSCKLLKVSDEWMASNKIVKPIAFPTCNDSIEGNNIFKADTSKAIKYGLTYRSIEDSIKDGLQYYLDTEDSLDSLNVGMNYKDMMNYIEGLKLNQ